MNVTRKYINNHKNFFSLKKNTILLSSKRKVILKFFKKRRLVGWSLFRLFQHHIKLFILCIIFLPKVIYEGRNFLIKTGLFFAHSTKERLLMDGIENNSNSSFDTFNYGLNLGAGIEYNLSKFKFEYGLKTEIGFHNITANTINLPKKFDYATTYLLAGYISVRYLF